MLDHLWAGGPMPEEYLKLYLCRDVYHCTPPELDRIPLDDILTHITCLQVEAKVRKM